MCYSNTIIVLYCLLHIIVCIYTYYTSKCNAAPMYIVLHVIMTNCNKHEIVENLTVGTNQQVHYGNFYQILITFSLPHMNTTISPWKKPQYCTLNS